MKKDLKELLKMEFLNEDVQATIMEAFQTKIKEAEANTRETVTRELTEQYARRYAEAKAELINATDKMVTESVTRVVEEKKAELASLREEKKKLVEARKAERQKYRSNLQTHTKMLESFILRSLSSELTEFSHDHRELNRERVVLQRTISEQERLYRKKLAEHTARLTDFTGEQMKKHLTELNEDHRDMLAKKRELQESIRTSKAEYQKKINQTIAALRESVMAELMEEKSRLDAERAALVEQRRESVQSLREHREALTKASTERMKKLEGFVVEQVSRELSEFEADKTVLKEERVRLHREAKEKLAETQRQFVSRAAKVVEETVASQLNREMTVLREDIEEARKNNFGRKIFEAFAADFLTSHYSEGKEVRAIKARLEESQNELARLRKLEGEKTALLESANRKAKLAEEKAHRTKVLSELLTPLDKKNREVMSNMLSTVKTEKLRESFNTYLPAILGGKTQSRSVLVESPKTGSKTTVVEVTGNREPSRMVESAVAEDKQTNNAEIVHLRRLAGLE